MIQFTFIIWKTQHIRKKFSGLTDDGFYAVFGFDTSIQDAVDNSCKAGFWIFEEIEIFNATCMYKHFRHLFLGGIGVYAAKVITGNIGIGVNDSLTIMGLPVNVASRLQGATKAFNNSISCRLTNLIYLLADQEV